MSTRLHAGAVLVCCCAALAALPALASAAPPSNDARTAPQDLGPLPAVVRGTTAEATLEEDEPGSSCGPIKNSVWFSFTAPSSRELLVALDAAGDLDATVEVFSRQRSQLTPLTCQQTDRRGAATIDADAAAGTTYLVRVAPARQLGRRQLHPPGGAPRRARPAARRSPPGRGDQRARGPLREPRRRLVDAACGKAARTASTSSPWGKGCVQVALYASGDFGGNAAESLACDDHTVFAAPASGRYTLHVRAPRASRVQLPYRLRVGLAERDDSAPGARARRRPARRGRAGRRRARRPRSLPVHARAPQRPARAARHDQGLRSPAPERGRPTPGLQLRVDGKQGAHPPPRARALLHRRAGPRRRARQVRAVAPRPHHHPRDDARRRQPQRHGGARRDRGTLAAGHARGVAAARACCWSATTRSRAGCSTRASGRASAARRPRCRSGRRSWAAGASRASTRAPGPPARATEGRPASEWSSRSTG